jgi:hypothetical protein
MTCSANDEPIAESFAFRYQERTRPATDVVCIFDISEWWRDGVQSTHGVRSDVCADSRLVEGVHGGIASVKHPKQFENVAV